MNQSADVMPNSAQIPKPGLTILTSKQARFQRRVILALTVGPLVGFFLAIWLLWGQGLSTIDFGIMLATYLITGLGVTVGYHRLFTHRSFETTRFLRAFFAIAGSMAVEGSVITWVSNHRRHHAFSDAEGDPHSPHLEEEAGIKGVLKGLWHAHIGWLFDPETGASERWSPDLLKDPLMRKIDRLFPLWAVLSFTIPGVLGLVITQSLTGALTALIWGGLARVFFLHHVTWSINSICHYYGERAFQTRDYSTNNWPLSLLSFGESWHNNHHAFPTSAVHGLGRWQIDLSAMIILSLEKLGLARNVRRVSSKQLENKEIA